MQNVSRSRTLFVTHIFQWLRVKYNIILQGSSKTALPSNITLHTHVSPFLTCQGGNRFTTAFEDQGETVKFLTSKIPKNLIISHSQKLLPSKTSRLVCCWFTTKSLSALTYYICQHAVVNWLHDFMYTEQLIVSWILVPMANKTL